MSEFNKKKWKEERGEERRKSESKYKLRKIIEFSRLFHQKLKRRNIVYYFLPAVSHIYINNYLA